MNLLRARLVPLVPRLAESGSFFQIPEVLTLWRCFALGSSSRHWREQRAVAALSSRSVLTQPAAATILKTLLLPQACPASPRPPTGVLGHAGGLSRSDTWPKAAISFRIAAPATVIRAVALFLPKLFRHGPLAAKDLLRTAQSAHLSRAIPMTALFRWRSTLWQASRCFDRFQFEACCSGSPSEELLVIVRRPITSPAPKRTYKAGDQHGTAALDPPEATGPITAAMNRALLGGPKASVCCFLDDDHHSLARIAARPSGGSPALAWTLIAGRVLQPWLPGSPDAETAATLPLQNSLKPRRAVIHGPATSPFPRQMGARTGGVDEKLTACSLIALKLSLPIAGGNVSYQSATYAEALIDHLATSRGGTRKLWRTPSYPLRSGSCRWSCYYQPCSVTRPFHSQCFALLRASRASSHTPSPAIGLGGSPHPPGLSWRGLFWAFWLS